MNYQIFDIALPFDAVTEDAPFFFRTQNIFGTPRRPDELFTHRLGIYKNSDTGQTVSEKS
jgi:hypothetical protein